MRLAETGLERLEATPLPYGVIVSGRYSVAGSFIDPRCPRHVFCRSATAPASYRVHA
jgi:hypothetical protein